MVTATKAGNSFLLVTGSRGEHGGLERQTIKDHKETFWGDVYVHFLDFDDVSWVYITSYIIHIYIFKIYQIAYFIYVRLVICQLYLKIKKI